MVVYAYVSHFTIGQSLSECALNLSLECILYNLRPIHFTEKIKQKFLCRCSHHVTFCQVAKRLPPRGDVGLIGVVGRLGQAIQTLCSIFDWSKWVKHGGAGVRCARSRCAGCPRRSSPPGAALHPSKPRTAGRPTRPRLRSGQRVGVPHDGVPADNSI